MRGAKSANSKLFKDFCNEAEMEKNIQIGGIYFSIVPKTKIGAFSCVGYDCINNSMDYLP